MVFGRSKSNPTSRSSSVMDLCDLMNEESADLEVEGSRPHEINDIAQNPSTKAMLKHPLGQILLKIQATNLQLCKKNNINPSTCNLQDLCDSFLDVVSFQEKSFQKMLDNFAPSLEEKITGKINSIELNHFDEQQSVVPPLDFAPFKVIGQGVGRVSLKDVESAFPVKPNQRFTGNPEGVDIIEFLQSMNMAQRTIGLSEAEFIDYLIKSTSGEACKLISSYLEVPMDLDTIYHNLLSNYDDRMPPSQAKAQLSTFRIPKYLSMAKGESKIMSLASRASVTFPPGAPRRLYYDIESCNCLIKALPTESSNLANNKYQTLCAQFNRNPTYAEFMKSLMKHADSINEDIKRFGATSNYDRNDRRSGRISALNFDDNQRSQQNYNQRNYQQNDRYYNNQQNRDYNQYSRNNSPGRRPLTKSQNARVNMASSNNRYQNNKRDRNPINQTSYTQSYSPEDKSGRQSA